MAPILPVIAKIKEPTIGMSYVLENEEDLVEITATDFTPRKRRAKKLKEQLDEKFLRRSKRNAVKLDSFKSAAENPKENEVLSPIPLAIIPAPGSAAGPRLTENVMQGIASSFPQIQPSVLSAPILKTDANADHN